jgi:Tlde1 domain
MPSDATQRPSILGADEAISEETTVSGQGVMPGRLQITGDLTCVNSTTGQVYDHCVAYSGIGADLNDPYAQFVPFQGPLPRGYYLIGFPTHDKGPMTLPLLPPPFNDMGGRYGFLIHGDNHKRNHTGSNGCIVANPDCRAKIPPGEVLRVTW